MCFNELYCAYDGLMAQMEFVSVLQELEAIKARVREMEEEAEKLKELQNEVEKQMNLSPPPGVFGYLGFCEVKTFLPIFPHFLFPSLSNYTIKKEHHDNLKI